MTQEKFRKLSAVVDDFCAEEKAKFVFEEQTNALIRDILEAVHEDQGHKVDYMALIEKIRISCNCSERLMSATISMIGYNIYDKDSPGLAETIFRIAVELCPETDARTNLAYVCRRHRDQISTSDVEIIDLLLDGVKQREPFSLINMALHFAGNLGRRDDWRLSDRMIGLLDSEGSDISSAVDWWRNLAEENDEEGFLVLCWLERHGKYAMPQPLREKLPDFHQRCLDIPQWIFEPGKKE